MLKWGWGTANRQFEFTITSYCLINKICRFIMSPFKYRLNQKPAVLCDWTDWLSSSTNDRRVLLHGCLAPLISKTTSSVFKWVEIICSFYSFFPSALQYIFVLCSLQWWAMTCAQHLCKSGFSIWTFDPYLWFKPACHNKRCSSSEASLWKMLRLTSCQLA